MSNGTYEFCIMSSFDCKYLESVLFLVDSSVPLYFGPFAVWGTLKVRLAWRGTRGASWKACLRIFRDQTPLEFLARPPVELRSAFSLHLARSAKKLVGRNSHWLIRLGRSFSRGRGSFARPKAELVLPRFSCRRCASFVRRSTSCFYSPCTSALPAIHAGILA